MVGTQAVSGSAQGAQETSGPENEGVVSDGPVLAEEPAAAQRPPRTTLSVRGYASGIINREFKLLLDPGFLDRQTLSVVETGVAQQVAILSMHRYSYRVGDKKGKAKAMRRRERDVANATGALYAQLTSALSKHEVIVRHLALLPAGSTGGIARAGVYAGR